MAIKPGVLAITLIAVGTSIPDAISTYRAARESKSADASMGNLLGVNGMTLLLGLGIPWVIAIIFYDKQEQGIYEQPRAGMLFAIAIYMIASIIGLFVIAVRRCCGGEIGGSAIGKYISATILFLLWVTFIVLVCLQEY